MEKHRGMVSTPYQVLLNLGRCVVKGFFPYIYPVKSINNLQDTVELTRVKEPVDKLPGFIKHKRLFYQTNFNYYSYLPLLKLKYYEEEDDVMHYTRPVYFKGLSKRKKKSFRA